MNRSRRQCVAFCAAAILFAHGVLAQPPWKAQPEVDDDVEASWRSLDWDDFNREITGWGREGAMIASRITLQDLRIDVAEDGDEHVARVSWARAQALMNKLESAYRRGSRDDWTLAHEQAHFDITEVWARRLRKGLRSMETRAGTPTEARDQLGRQVDRLYRDVLEQWRRMQDSYDGETGHGTKKRQQKRWLKQVQEALREPL